MPPKSNIDDEEEESVEHFEFVYDSEDQEITEEIRQSVTKLIVRGPNVKTIKEGGFKECENLKEVDFTEATALETIGEWAFFKCPICENLKKVDFTEATALETIGELAFWKCPSLLAFKCPSNVTSIGESAFQDCSKLKEVNFTQATSLQTIGLHAFLNCGRLLTFKCPSNVKTIGVDAFAICENLKEVDFTEANALETIQEQAFRKCPSLLAFKYPCNVTAIGYAAFSECEKLEEVDFTKATALERIGYRAFYKCPSLLAFNCPSNVKTVGQYAFQQCENLKKVDFTKATALETIEYGAFTDTGPEMVYVAPNVTVVGKNILQNCPKLQSLKIPSVNPAIHIRLYTALYEDQRKNVFTLDDIVSVYACNPIKNSELLENVGDEKSILDQLRAKYIGSIVDGSRRLLSIPDRNWWLQFLVNNVGDGTDDPDMRTLLDHLKTVDIKRVRQLAETKDQSGRVAKSVASKHIQKVFEER
ncbi:unnamed protein product [Cylindrotheca closterium]|uniref:Leucine-rich repeat domain-containing protein n=1 Tax=Cylindrotheca closterium TaxID=2856 RepID=A0AAD2CSC5_9STRA|nr:unnamed protein product [Cylindrotheca closterium]